jgi:superfamily II DNA/RNA helicase
VEKAVSVSSLPEVDSPTIEQLRVADDTEAAPIDISKMTGEELAKHKQLSQELDDLSTTFDAIYANLDRIGVTNPTRIQEIAIPLMSKGKSLILQAQTGSGKTLAFALPLLHLINPKLRHVSYIYF